MIETIISIVLSVVSWVMNKNQQAKLSAERYVDYIKKWIENTPDSSEISDEHDELMNRSVNDEDNNKPT